MARVGWAIAPPAAAESIRKIHDFLTVGAAAPLQAAGAMALELPDTYYERLSQTYGVKRDRMLGILSKAGFECFKPLGAYYIITDISRFGFGRRHRFRALPGAEDRPRHCARLELLQSQCRRRPAGSLHVLQEG